MKKSWKTKVSLLLSVLCCLWLVSAPYSYAEKTYTITESQMTTLQNNLTQLKKNNEMLKKILDQQNQDWTQVSTLQTGQAADLMTLKQQLTESQTEIASLQTQLNQVDQELQMANQSLMTANAELSSASKSYQEYKKIQEKTENRLTWQRNLWAALSAVLGGGLIYQGIHK